MLVEILIFLLTSLLAFLLYSHYKVQDSFKNKGLKFVPGVPIFGNNIKSTFSKRHIVEDLDEVYNACRDEKYCGYVEGVTPIILVRDPELIKQITVKDFDYFADHRQFFDADLFNDSLLLMKGERWRDMRATLSPAFTGSKMRGMVPFMIETSESFMDYLKEIEGTEILTDDMVRRYTNDIIASSAFGIKINSLKDRDNQFYTMGQKLMNFTILQKLLIACYSFCPFLSKVIPIFPREITSFFRGMVNETMEYRQKNNIERPDMVQLLMEAAKGTLKAENDNEKDNIGFATADDYKVKSKHDIRNWSKDELAAQAFIFFFAGYESSASALTMAIHELAINEDVQKKLHEEISNYSRDNKELSYEGIQSLKYMDGVINETLRKWSAALILDRVCLKPYVLPPPHEGGKPYQMKVGEIIYNSVNSVHMDPDYYQDPQKFDPDRFSDQNKSSIKPFTFMPFGVGPRNCIGSRFALLEVKIFLFYLVKTFHILKTEKTQNPVHLSKSSFSIKADGGTYVKLQTRA